MQTSTQSSDALFYKRGETPITEASRRTSRGSLPVYISIDQFTNLVLLSQRSNSKVIKAVCKATGEEVALKCFEKSALSPKEAIHVAREVALLGFLCGDPGVVQIFGCFEDDTHAYIAMEHCAGRDLYHKLLTDMYFDDEFVCTKVLIPLLQMLDRLHTQHKIVHRDIKPENLLLTAKGELRLADFGTAIKQDLEVPFLPVGTLDFMAPEVLGSIAPKGAVESPCTTMEMLLEHKLTPYNEKVDVWSVGALAYELMVGETPFYHRSPVETRRIILGSAYLYFPKPLKHTPFEVFVRAAMTKAPADRPSAAELLEYSWLKQYQTKPRLAHSKSDPLQTSPLMKEAVASYFKSDSAVTLTLHVDTTSRTLPPPSAFEPPVGMHPPTLPEAPQPMDSAEDDDEEDNNANGSHVLMPEPSFYVAATDEVEEENAGEPQRPSGISSPLDSDSSGEERSNSRRLSGNNSDSKSGTTSTTVLPKPELTRAKSAPVVAPNWTLDRFPHTALQSQRVTPNKTSISNEHSPTNAPSLTIRGRSGSRGGSNIVASLGRITERSTAHERESDLDSVSTGAAPTATVGGGNVRSAPASRRGSSFLKRPSRLSLGPLGPKSSTSMSAEIPSLLNGRLNQLAVSTPSQDSNSGNDNNKTQGNKQGVSQMKRIKSYLKHQTWLRSFGLKSTTTTAGTSANSSVSAEH